MNCVDQATKVNITVETCKAVCKQYLFYDWINIHNLRIGIELYGTQLVNYETEDCWNHVLKAIRQATKESGMCGVLNSIML